MYMESINVSQFTPADPTGTANGTGQMMGLGTTCVVTPRSSGRFLILASGTVFNAGIGQGVNLQLRTGTGVAPANAAALTGTASGGLQHIVDATITSKGSFGVNGIVSGLTVGTAVWIDISLAAVTAGTATITDVSVSVVEL